MGLHGQVVGNTRLYYRRMWGTTRCRLCQGERETIGHILLFHFLIHGDQEVKDWLVKDWLTFSFKLKTTVHQ